MNDLILKYRLVIIFFLQMGIILASFLMAYGVPFDFRIPRHFLQTVAYLIPALLVIKISVFWRMGLFQGWWRYVSLPDLINILKANLVASLGFILYTVFVHRLENVPRVTLALDGTFCFLLMGGVRFATRAFRENYLPMSQGGKRKRTRVLIVGAGAAGQMIVREFRMNPGLALEAIGFIDDDPQKKGERFQGVPVLGRQEDIHRICNQQHVDEVIIAIPSASGREIRRIMERCLESGVQFKTLPGVGDLIDGKVAVQSIREVKLEDLLGRETARLDVQRINAYLSGKRVLVTGAGGSIGSEICRQIARFEPEKIILFDNAETPLFHIEQEISRLHPGIRLAPIVGDIRYRARVEAIFDEFMPEVVFHAAAYKHVPMMEFNPAEAVNNNARGTAILADASHAFGVQNFVLISTDKAVNPTNVMGATKRAAELYVQSMARQSSTNFVTVRFGNVLGSSGSVVPIFKEQIRMGGPVTVTHPDVSRFFMTIPEATQLVLQAGSMGRGGEIFLLDMGEPVKIVHLAEELIRLSGLRPHEDIDIVFTGLRPGEKLHEELLLAGEGTLPTIHEKIMVAKATTGDAAKLKVALEELFNSARAMDLEGLDRKLVEIVPEFCPAQGARRAKVIIHPAVRERDKVRGQ